MGGIRKSAPFLHLRVSLLGRDPGRKRAEMLFRLNACTRNAISCAQGAVTPRPLYRADDAIRNSLFSSRSGWRFLFIDRDGMMEMRMLVMRYVHVHEVNHGDFKELEDLYQATRKDSPDKRATREAPNKDARDALKRILPCWYLGGTMNGPCCAANARPAGVLQIDIDDTDRPQELKNRLAGIDNVAFAAVSASGRGVYALMRVPVSIQASQDAQKGILDMLDPSIPPPANIPPSIPPVEDWHIAQCFRGFAKNSPDSPDSPGGTLGESGELFFLPACT